MQRIGVWGIICIGFFAVHFGFGFYWCFVGLGKMGVRFSVASLIRLPNLSHGE